MLYTPLTKKAIKIAYNAHSNQFDRDNIPYIFHPWEVANQVQDDEYATVVALLHDIVEDTNYTYEDLRKNGFPEEIIQGIDGMTKRDNEDYFEFIQRAKQNPLSRKVKVADIKHNMDLSRLTTITDNDMERYEKYKKALEYLLQE